MFLDTYFFTIDKIGLFSLIFFGLSIFVIKSLKLSRIKIKKIAIIAFVSAVLAMFFSVFYYEKHIGGMFVGRYHGLPHYYLIEGKYFDGESEMVSLLNNAEGIFLESGFSKIIKGIDYFYFIIDFLFWYLLFYCVMLFFLLFVFKIANH